MANRNKNGNHVYEKVGVIKITTDSNRDDHISFYSGPVERNHVSVHINTNYSERMVKGKDHLNIEENHQIKES